MQTANEVLGSGDGGGFDVEGVEGGGCSMWRGWCHFSQGALR